MYFYAFILYICRYVCYHVTSLHGKVTWLERFYSVIKTCVFHSYRGCLGRMEFDYWTGQAMFASEFGHWIG